MPLIHASLEDQWRTLPSGLRRELTGATISELVSDLAGAADAGALEDPEVVLAKTQEQALAIAADRCVRCSGVSAAGAAPVR